MVENELRIMYFDIQPNSVPLAKRLLDLGDSKATFLILTDFVHKYREKKLSSPEYILLVNAIRALGELKVQSAVNELAEIARKDEVSEAKLLAIHSIGQIDPKGNRSLLPEALHNTDYSVRSLAAEGLSRTDDQSVLYELEVVASRESSRETSRAIQAFADTLRARMNAKSKE
jgi:HEAT repeat protein